MQRCMHLYPIYNCESVMHVDICKINLCVQLKCRIVVATFVSYTKSI